MAAKAAAAELWAQAGLPPSALAHLSLPPSPSPPPSSFDVDAAAQAVVGVAALAAAHLHALRTRDDLSAVTVLARDAAAEFRSQDLALLGGESAFEWDALAGAYKAKLGGWIRPHTNWRHHKVGLLDLLDLPHDASKAQLAEAFASRDADEVAEAAMDRGLVCTALRSFEEWDAHPQGRAALERARHGPVRFSTSAPRPPRALPASTSRRPLDSVRVLDLTRVIAGPVAGRVLAGYGADVLWVTSPSLPSLPGLDFDTSRGKRTLQLDLRSSPADRAAFERLVRDADVLLESYRPGGLASLGFGPERLRELNPDIGGPWSRRKGFDSLVQFASGFGEAEGRAWSEWRSGRADEEDGTGEWAPRALPCQVLDHATGYLTAFGILAALYHRSTSGGAHLVTTTLLDTATWLRSLGRTDASTSTEPFSVHLETQEELRARGGTARLRGWEGKEVEYVEHAARFEGDVEVGWRTAPQAYADGAAEWLARGE
ncbi:uncharacterized protein RHOBADRAFT_32544 [Rhodotorula graminis WP1]|uniref:CoA-transferase family III n=1 Tax=Rhodotorula graminis (strain WP1) TaxID=578459 RepID=A0A194SBI3_RHOGW|nr:uncharacterized protein RHOBADRAFT_32544 [Rhodotorula graminis WP1]KPV77957.1 hypothetical protein RHOBADRAFT_32544 [Rhodotorula graminis WP1]